jgi:hypothetical protein
MGVVALTEELCSVNSALAALSKSTSGTLCEDLGRPSLGALLVLDVVVGLST